MKFTEVPINTPDNEFVFIECDITGKTKKTRYGAAKENVKKNNGQYITNWGLMKLNNPMKNKSVQDKIKQTCLEKYGTTCPMNTKENIQDRVEKMFGTEVAKEAIVKKRKKTSIERFGAEHIMMTEEGKERQRAGTQEKYGVDYPLQNPKVLLKMAETIQKRYGVDNVAQLPEVQEKMKATSLELYGVEHYNQLPEMKEYLKDNCTEWLAESYAKPWAKGITRPVEWNDKQRETVTKLIIEGNWKASYASCKKGFCYPKKCKKQSVYIRSSYEAIYCYYLDHNDDVDWYSFEAFRIPYEYKGKTHYYIPDFIIKWKDGAMAIHELKATYMKEDEKVIAKQLAGELHASNSDMDYKLIFCKDIADLNIKLEDLVNNNYVVLNN